MKTAPEYTIHPDSPQTGDIVRCIDKKKRSIDPKGYRVEEVGSKEGFSVPYGFFAARGVAYGGLYQFNVSEFEYFNTRE